MDRVQQNGGTAGLVAGVLLVIGFALYYSLGPDLMDPVKSLQVFVQKPGLATLTTIVFFATVALAILFSAGLMNRLREPAPTRAVAQLYFAIIGLSALILDGIIRWVGSGTLSAASDQVAAGHAWLALTTVASGVTAFGNAFTGASLLLAGWAVATTGALPAFLGWVAIIAGVFTWAAVFAPTNQLVLLVGFLLPAVWLIWGGAALRRAAMMPMSRPSPMATS